MLADLLIALLLLIAALVALDRFAPATAASLALAAERRLAGLSVGFARTDEFAFAYLRGGRGEPLVLIHGFGADKDNFARVGRHLKKHFDVIAIDLPGFGDSDRLPAASYRIPDQARRVVAMLDALGLDRVHLGGSSMGGAISVEIAASHPERVASLWLLAPGGVMTAPDSEMIAGYRASGVSELVLKSVAGFNDLLRFTMSRVPFLPYSLKQVLGRRGVADRELHTRVFDEIATSPATEERAREVSAPALIVWGEEDRVLHVKGAALLEAELQNAQRIELPGIGHLPMIEVPRQSARDYLAFSGKS